MNNFQICTPTKLAFGKDTQHQIGELLKPYAKKVLLHYGGGTAKKIGLYDDTKKPLPPQALILLSLAE